MANEKTIKVSGRKVTIINHETKTSDGSVVLTTTFDFTGCTSDQILAWAASNRLISWRTSGVKKLTTKEAKEKLTDAVIDCSKGFEAQESEEAKRIKAVVEKIKAGGLTLEQLEEMAAKIKEQRDQEDMEAGEAE